MKEFNAQHPLFLSKGEFYRATPAMTPDVGYTVSIEGPDWSYIKAIKLGVLRTYFKPDPYENVNILNQVDHLLNTQII